MVYNGSVIALSLQNPRKATRGVKVGKIKLSSKKLLFPKVNDIGTLIKGKQRCPSSLLQNEHNGVYFIRKTNNFLFKNKMLFRILY